MVPNGPSNPDMHHCPPPRHSSSDLPTRLARLTYRGAPPRKPLSSRIAKALASGATVIDIAEAEGIGGGECGCGPNAIAYVKLTSNWVMGYFENEGTFMPWWPEGKRLLLTAHGASIGTVTRTVVSIVT